MARLLVLLVLCALSTLVSTSTIKKPFLVRGQVYCDTCCAGFETPATTYIRGAKVMIVCKDKNSMQPVYITEGKTNLNGTFNILVKDDHQDQICDVVLVSSPQADCKSADPRRNRARVILTDNNGIVSKRRFANAMGFLKDKPLAGCSELLKQYVEYDE